VFDQGIERQRRLCLSPYLGNSSDQLMMGIDADVTALIAVGCLITVIYQQDRISMR
jgi:hypothetical protein